MQCSITVVQCFQTLRCNVPTQWYNVQSLRCNIQSLWCYVQSLICDVHSAWWLTTTLANKNAQSASLRSLLAAERRKLLWPKSPDKNSSGRSLWKVYLLNFVCPSPPPPSSPSNKAGWAQGRRRGWKDGRVHCVVNQYFATKFWGVPC